MYITPVAKKCLGGVDVEVTISVKDGIATFKMMCMHRRKSSNEILPGVDLQILPLIE